MDIIPGKVRMVPQSQTRFSFDSNLPIVHEIECNGFINFSLPALTDLDFELEGYCHLTQTDWLQCTIGEGVIIVQSRGQLVYIPAKQEMTSYIEIGPKTWHCGLNLGPSICVGHNLVMRHAPAHRKDYRPSKLGIRFDPALAVKALGSNMPQYA
jgi:hypothetical protein